MIQVILIFHFIILFISLQQNSKYLMPTHKDGLANLTQQIESNLHFVQSHRLSKHEATVETRRWPVGDLTGKMDHKNDTFMQEVYIYNIFVSRHFWEKGREDVCFPNTELVHLDPSPPLGSEPRSEPRRDAVEWPPRIRSHQIKAFTYRFTRCFRKAHHPFWKWN